LPEKPVEDGSKEPINSAGYRQKQVSAQPPSDKLFLKKTHGYIRKARAEAETAQASLTASGYIRPIEYSNKFNSLDKTKKSFEEFRDLLDRTPHLPTEIILSHEQFRLKVNRTIAQIEALKSCIQDPASPCQDIKERFRILLQTLVELGMYCEIDDSNSPL